MSDSRGAPAYVFQRAPDTRPRIGLRHLPQCIQIPTSFPDEVILVRVISWLDLGPSCLDRHVQAAYASGDPTARSRISGIGKTALQTISATFAATSCQRGGRPEDVGQGELDHAQLSRAAIGLNQLYWSCFAKTPVQIPKNCRHQPILSLSQNTN